MPRLDEYPPEYDYPDYCFACGKIADDDCQCPECPGCGEVGNLDCYEKAGHLPSFPRPITCLEDLVREVAWIPPSIGEDAVERDIAIIEKRLFKDTKSGIGFSYSNSGYILLSGYCEGSDAELPCYRLDFPFLPDYFWHEVDAADRDGCEEWDRTHGCPDCYGLSEPDDWGNMPVNPKCKSCMGQGQLI